MKTINRFFKGVAFLFVICLMVLDSQAQRKKVGLVLSGGGAKGVAHVGVLKVLEEAGIPVDYIAGTSMGAIVGGLYAIGYDAETLDALVRKQDWTHLLSDRVFRYNVPFSEKESSEKFLLTLPIRKRSVVMPPGFVSGQNIYNLFLDLTVGYHDSTLFKELPIPFACVASDLTDGQEVLLDRGNLALAMRASMAIPGAFAPIVTEGKVLVDGGISNNFPVDVARDMGADILIGVDVQADLKDEKGLESVMGVVDQLTSLLGIAKYEENKKLLDFYIKPDINPFSAASFSKSAIDTLIYRGEQAARLQWDDLMELKKRIGITGDEKPQQRPSSKIYGEQDTIRIDRIIMQGVDKRDERWLRSIIRMKGYGEVTMEEIHKAIAELYGSGAFSHVNFKLTGAPHYDLIFTMENKKINSLNIGFRFDTEEMAAILVNSTYMHRSLRGSRLSFTGRLSTNPYVMLEYSLGNTFLRRFNLSYAFRYNDLSIYDKGKKSDNVTYSYHMGSLGMENLHFKNFALQLGLRYEYYNYDTFLFSSREDVFDVKPEGIFSYYALAQMDTYDKRYYPNQGFSFKLSYSLYTDNLVDYKGSPPFSAFGFSYEPVVNIARRLKLLPSLYGRVLMGDNLTYSALNTIGGLVPGRYVPQQLPFAGVQQLEIVDHSVVIAKLNLRYRLGSRHYLSLVGNYLKHEDNFLKILDGRSMFGQSVSYSYDTLVGPIDFVFMYSDWTKKVGFFFNLGFHF